MEKVLPYILCAVIGSFITIIFYLIKNGNNKSRGLAGTKELCKQVSTGISKATDRIGECQDAVGELIEQTSRINDILSKYGDGDKNTTDQEHTS